MLYSNLSEAILNYANFVRSICKQSGNGVYFLFFGFLELFFESQTVSVFVLIQTPIH